MKVSSACKTACFRADADSVIGGGHVMRCLTMAMTLKEAGWACSFLSSPATLDAVPVLLSSNLAIVALDCRQQDEPDYIAARLPNGCDVLVVDHYGLDAQYERRCRKWARKLFVIEDNTDREHAADFLFDSTLGRTAEEYAGLVPKTCQLLLGPDYSLLRPQFVESRGEALKRRRQGKKLERIVISFGAADHKNMSNLVLRAIRDFFVEVDVDVVVGNSFAHHQELKDIAQSCPFPVTIHQNVSEMAGLFAKADLAVGAAGSSAWERCCLGLPAIVVVTAKNQESIAVNLSAAGAARVAGHWDAVQPADIGKALLEVKNDPRKLQQMAENGAALCDGRGSIRILQKLTQPVMARGKGAVCFRLATEDDKDLVYGWQQDPSTRAYFRNPEPPKYTEHCQWFQTSLDNPARTVNIILYNGEPAGVLRLDRIQSRMSEISIFLASGMRKLGIGKAALTYVRHLFPAENFQAEVAQENTASERLFESAGFITDKTGKYFQSGIVPESEDCGLVGVF